MDYPTHVRPIEPLLRDPEVTEIMINGHRQLWIERAGVMEQLEPVFADARQIMDMLDGLLGATGRSVNVLSPMVDFRLPDGSRINAVIPPIALDGPFVTIRKLTGSLVSMDDLVRIGTLSSRMAYLLYAAIRARLNVVFSGGAGTGKTTTLGLASGWIPESERIVLIEDTAELELRQQHVVRMECRPPGLEGAGKIQLCDLLRNSLRMRPNRIIIGEVRGDEAIEMLQAMTSGHDGCLAVLHASAPAHAISRLEMMILSRGLPLPLWGIQRQIADAIDLIVQMAQLSDGSRRVTHITEVRGVGEDQVELADLHVFEQTGFDAQGRVAGRFRCTGARPAFEARFEHLQLDEGWMSKLFEAGVD